MIADDVATYLAEQGLGTKGKTIFVNHVDTSKTEAIVIYDTGSIDIDEYIDLDEPTIQIIVISKKHATAKKNSMDIFKLLNRKNKTTMGNITSLWSQALQTPFHLGYEDNRHKVSTNYKVRTCVGDTVQSATDFWLWDTGDKILWDTGDGILI